MSECLFCQIVAKEVPAEIVHEDDDVIAFKDLDPKAPVHLLVVPKQHVQDIHHASDSTLVAKLIATTRQLAEEQDHRSEGYRLVVNSGSQAEIPHLHIHLLTGSPKLGRIADRGGD
jgi:histidine triad (HIT) family protein